MKGLVARFLSDESGAAAIEYALIAGLIALAIVGGATVLGTKIDAKFTGISNHNALQ
jgi:pilus assembly protein Flp/PilA